jgi:hypothetical protein
MDHQTNKTYGGVEIYVHQSGTLPQKKARGQLQARVY